MLGDSQVTCTFPGSRGCGQGIVVRMRLLVPNLLPLDLDLPVGCDVEVYDVAKPIPAAQEDADVLVVWGNSGSALGQSAPRLTRLQLIQSLAAGTDAIFAADFRTEARVCSGVGLHDRPVAEHAMALILALVRRLPAMLEAQRDSRWATEYSGTQPLHPQGPVTTLLDARVLIWGFGSIAATLAPMLSQFGAAVRGVARSGGQREGVQVITQDELNDVLPETDILINILPATPATRHALDAQHLELLPDHAYVVNVGRGATVDEGALVVALQAGSIAGAALDVMETEPLPSDSPLWTAPNIVLTPHCAGGRPINAGALVSRNVRALIEGGELVNLVHPST